MNVAQRGSEGLRISGVQVPVHGSDRASDLGGDLADSQVGVSMPPIPLPRGGPVKRKSVALQIKSAAGQTGTFTGLASVFDNVDYDGDIVRRGAFNKSLGSGTPIPLIWMHKADDPRNYVGVVVAAAGASRAAVAVDRGGVVVAEAGAGTAVVAGAVAVLLSPKLAGRAVVAGDAGGVAVAVGRGGAVLLSPLTIALLWSPPVAVATLLSPLAFAIEPSPEVAVAVPFCTFALTVLRDAHILSVALTVPRLGRCRPWRRGQPYPDAQGDR